MDLFILNCPRIEGAADTSDECFFIKVKQIEAIMIFRGYVDKSNVLLMSRICERLKIRKDYSLFLSF